MKSEVGETRWKQSQVIQKVIIQNEPFWNTIHNIPIHTNSIEKSTKSNRSEIEISERVALFEGSDQHLLHRNHSLSTVLEEATVNIRVVTQLWVFYTILRIVFGSLRSHFSCYHFEPLAKLRLRKKKVRKWMIIKRKRRKSMHLTEWESFWLSTKRNTTKQSNLVSKLATSGRSSPATSAIYASGKSLLIWRAIGNRFIT